MKNQIKQKRRMSALWHVKPLISIWLICALLLQLLPLLIIETATMVLPSALGPLLEAVAE